MGGGEVGREVLGRFLFGVGRDPRRRSLVDDLQNALRQPLDEDFLLLARGQLGIGESVRAEKHGARRKAGEEILIRRHCAQRNRDAGLRRPVPVAEDRLPAESWLARDEAAIEEAVAEQHQPELAMGHVLPESGGPGFGLNIYINRPAEPEPLVGLEQIV